jgi:two-component system, chemotaxis family, protein-glutamate methylesterase/glutaminase
MTQKHLVVVGASAGGLEALRSLVSRLPDKFPAAIGVVLHTAPESPGVLADILDRSGPLPATSPHDTQRIEAGHIYVAPPDRHLLIEPGHLRVTKGPREHGFRPAIDPLFRSAAQVFGPGAIGVVLTGNLDDGTAGLWTIKKLGGTAIVQDPGEALFPSMPEHALQHVDVDYVASLSQVPALLADLTMVAPAFRKLFPLPAHIEMDVNIAKEKTPREAGLERIGTPSPYACPDCHGVLLELEEGDRVRYRCHIGHAYSVDSLLAAMGEGIEQAMSTAHRALEESSLLMERIATRFDERDNHEASTRMREASVHARRRAEGIKDLMRDTPVPTADPALDR